MQRGMRPGQFPKDTLRTFELATNRTPRTPLTVVHGEGMNLMLLKVGLRCLLPNPALIGGLSNPERDLVRELQDHVDYYKCQNNQMRKPDNQRFLDTMATDLQLFLSMVLLNCFLLIAC